MYNGNPKFEMSTRKYHILHWITKISTTQRNIVTFSHIVFKFEYDRMELSKVSLSFRLEI